MKLNYIQIFIPYRAVNTNRAGYIKQSFKAVKGKKIAVLFEANKKHINPLTPTEPYWGRTAPLTSKVAFYIFIQQI